VEFFAQKAERRGVTKKDLAEALSKNPSQITRWLSAPSNFELDTLSEILLAMDAEMEHRIVRFTDRPKPNFMHPLIARVVNSNAASQNKAVVISGPTGTIKFKQRTGAGMTGAAGPVLTP
jgi:transcriptional regulator with XRE-family HTH domain